MIFHWFSQFYNCYWQNDSFGIQKGSFCLSGMGAGKAMVVDLFSSIFPRRDRQRDALFKILKKVPIFQDLSQREFDKIENILFRRQLVSDEVIVREGELSVGMFVVVSGEVEIIRTGDEGSMRRLAVLGPGDFFGEQALLNEEVPRTASAIASKPSQAVGFFRPDLQKLLRQNPRLGLKIVRRLSQMLLTRWRHTNRLLEEARAKKDKLEKFQLQKN